MTRSASAAFADARRAFCAWIVVAALALHGFIPLGYMPDASPRTASVGGVPIVICGGHAKKPDSAPGKKNKPASGFQQICSYSIGSLFTGAALPSAVGQDAAFAVVSLPRIDFRLPKPVHFGNAAPRAPPAFS